jgi:hypothetical protein
MGKMGADETRSPLKSTDAIVLCAPPIAIRPHDHAEFDASDASSSASAAVRARNRASGQLTTRAIDCIRLPTLCPIWRVGRRPKADERDQSSYRDVYTRHSLCKCQFPSSHYNFMY